MSSDKRVALVTGANKGIGFAIVRGLCKQFDGDVILTARNENNGKEAIELLNKEGLKPVFHQMDLNDVSSIAKIKTFLQSNYGGLDLLVNNAGIFVKAEFLLNSVQSRTGEQFHTGGPIPFSVQAEETMATNFWGTLKVCEQLFPILRPHARVVNISSTLSHRAANQCSQELVSQFTVEDLDMSKIEQLMTQFVSSAKDGTFKDKGWPETAYGVSKIGVTLMSFAQQKELAKDTSRPDIVVNACCPGYVNTDMTDHKGHKTIDEGADTPLYLALLPPNTTTPKGQFVVDKKVNQFP